jgi:hypothetical protein
VNLPRPFRLPVISLASLLLIGVLSGVAAGSPRPLPLSAHLIQPGEFVGFSREPAINRFRTVTAWVAASPHPTAAQASAQRARLRREGFKGVVSEYLDSGSTRRNGLSWVMQLGSPASARAELAASLRENKAQSLSDGGSFRPYFIPTIPGALGYQVRINGQVGENAFFADGPFLYLIGEGWSVGEKNRPTRARLIAAMTTLYKRVHGRSAA